jgi:plasmid stabilization system protein ParE
VKPLNLSEPASEELAEAVRWYEQRRAGLGGEFFDEIDRTMDLIVHHPEMGTLRPHRLETRQFVLTRFPYTVVYRIREHDLYVVAVAHAKRKPGYWKHRR